MNPIQVVRHGRELAADSPLGDQKSVIHRVSHQEQNPPASQMDLRIERHGSSHMRMMEEKRSQRSMIRHEALLKAGTSTAGEAAITLAAVTVGTDKEHRLAFAGAANPPPEDHFAVFRRALSPRRAGAGQGPDNGNGFVAPWKQLGW